MPIYEYQCQKCKKVHEITQRMTDAPLTKCPDCKGKLQKLLSLSGFQLKGGGWYKDGYSSAKTESAVKAPENTATPSASESTPTAKVETPKPSKPPKKKSAKA